MSRTTISYADRTHPFWTGCNEVSEGCRHCYAKRIAEAHWDRPFHDLRCAPEPKFSEPRRWQRSVIFPCSMSDFFHPTADQWRGKAWKIIKECHQHRWLILTKRIERWWQCRPNDYPIANFDGYGWDHVWLGTSVENQAAVDKRLPLLKQVVAPHKFISVEPLLEAVDLSPWLDGVEWVIVGGESGEMPRVMRPEWAEAIKHQCDEAGVIFHFKQMGGPVKIDGTWGGNKLHGKVYDTLPQFFPPELDASQLSLFQ